MPFNKGFIRPAMFRGDTTSKEDLSALMTAGYNPRFIVDFSRVLTSAVGTSSTTVYPSLGTDVGTFTRASIGHYHRHSDGKFVSAVNHEPRIGKLTAGGQGILMEPQATNKTQRGYNWSEAVGVQTITGWGGANTTTIVDDTAKIASAGLDIIVTDGKAMKLDHGGGGFTTITGLTGNTNAHSMSVYARGTGTIRAAFSGGGGQGAFATLTNDYQRFTFDNLTPTISGNMQLDLGTSGDIAYVLFPQMEENILSTSAIPNNTTGSLTRNGDNLEIKYTDTFNATNGGTLYAELEPISSVLAPSLHMARFEPAADAFGFTGNSVGDFGYRLNSAFIGPNPAITKNVETNRTLQLLTATPFAETFTEDTAGGAAGATAVSTMTTFTNVLFQGCGTILKRLALCEGVVSPGFMRTLKII